MRSTELNGSLLVYTRRGAGPSLARIKTAEALQPPARLTASCSGQAPLPPQSVNHKLH